MVVLGYIIVYFVTVYVAGNHLIAKMKPDDIIEEGLLWAIAILLSVFWPIIIFILIMQVISKVGKTSEESLDNGNG